MTAIKTKATIFTRLFFINPLLSFILTMPLARAATRGEIRGGDFSDATTGCLQPPRGKDIRSTKYCIGNIFTLYPL